MVLILKSSILITPRFINCFFFHLATSRAIDHANDKQLKYRLRIDHVQWNICYLADDSGTTRFKGRQMRTPDWQIVFHLNPAAVHHVMVHSKIQLNCLCKEFDSYSVWNRCQNKPSSWQLSPFLFSLAIWTTWCYNWNIGCNKTIRSNNQFSNCFHLAPRQSIWVWSLSSSNDISIDDNHLLLLKINFKDRKSIS